MTYRGALQDLVMIKNYPAFPAELVTKMDACIEVFEEEWGNNKKGEINMSELLDKQTAIDALREKMNDKAVENKPDVVLGLLVAVGVVSNLSPVKEEEK